ncbi:ABC transporter permease [Azoarcus olearius]|uniref:ABC transporter permease n=1 Tax=Azoarcus sp. (strain BH72) TaxID=418699 RepID=UPI001F1C10CE|nr:ABC transporter permease [Azoarcus olearius]
MSTPTAVAGARLPLTRLRALWRKETLTLLRDRHALAALFLMPAIFILVMSLALRDAFVPGVQSELAYAVVDLDRSPASQELVERLDRIAVLRAQGVLDDEAAGRSAVADGRLAFALVVPAGFGERLAARQGDEGAPPLRVLADPTVPRAVQSGFEQQVAAEAARLRVLTLLDGLGRKLMVPELRRQVGIDASPRVISEAVRSDAGAAAPPAVVPSSVQQSVPAWLIFSMFFVVVPLSAVFIAERQQGTLQRLATQQVPFGLVLAGKLLPYFVVNQVQAVVMVMVGRWLVPLAGGEALTLPAGAASLVALWLMAAAVSVAAVAWALLIASLTRSSEQATIVGGVGNILMGALGGIMVPKFLMPPEMQTLTQLSPMAWALDGFHRVMLLGDGVAGILPQAATLLCFGLAALAAAILRTGR